MLQTKGEVIITGDFNAKLEVETGPYKQKISPNGKQLQTLIEMNKLQAISL